MTYPASGRSTLLFFPLEETVWTAWEVNYFFNVKAAKAGILLPIAVKMIIKIRHK